MSAKKDWHDIKDTNIVFKNLEARCEYLMGKGYANKEDIIKALKMLAAYYEEE